MTSTLSFTVGMIVGVLFGSALRPSVREFLEGMEWVQLSYNGSPACPCCDRQQHMGHDRDCQMVAMLAAGRRQQASSSISIDSIALDVAREIKKLDPIAMRGGHTQYLAAIQELVADSIRAVLETEEGK